MKKKAYMLRDKKNNNNEMNTEQKINKGKERRNIKCPRKKGRGKRR